MSSISESISKVSVGNALFHYRNGLVPVAYVVALVFGTPLYPWGRADLNALLDVIGHAGRRDRTTASHRHDRLRLHRKRREEPSRVRQQAGTRRRVQPLPQSDVCRKHPYQRRPCVDSQFRCVLPVAACCRCCLCVHRRGGGRLSAAALRQRICGLPASTSAAGGPDGQAGTPPSRACGSAGAGCWSRSTTRASC